MLDDIIFLLNAKTGFRATLMVHAQSKAIIEQALQNDATFLSECNIMDYSLLVGIDDEKKEMIVGIVGKFKY
jgi:hypothetical protein